MLSAVGITELIGALIGFERVHEGLDEEQRHGCRLRFFGLDPARQRHQLSLGVTSIGA